MLTEKSHGIKTILIQCSLGPRMFSHAEIMTSWWLRFNQNLDRKEKKLVGFSTANPFLLPLPVFKLTQHQQLLQWYPLPSNTEESPCILALGVVRESGNLI